MDPSKLASLDVLPQDEALAILDEAERILPAYERHAKEATRRIRAYAHACREGVPSEDLDLHDEDSAEADAFSEVQLFATPALLRLARRAFALLAERDALAARLEHAGEELVRVSRAGEERVLALVEDDDRLCIDCRGAGELGGETCAFCGGERTYLASLHVRLGRAPGRER